MANDKNNPFASVPFTLLGSGIASAVVDGTTYLRISTDPTDARRTISGASDITASTGPWLDVPGVSKHPEHGGAFKMQLNAGYRVPKAKRV